MNKIYEEIRKIAVEYPEIKKVVLFGSRARNDNNERSDIDIAVYTEKYPFINEAKFWLDIEDIDTLLQFDIVVIDEETDKKLIENVNRDGVVIYGSNSTKI